MEFKDLVLPRQVWCLCITCGTDYFYIHSSTLEPWLPEQLCPRNSVLRLDKCNCPDNWSRGKNQQENTYPAVFHLTTTAK